MRKDQPLRRGQLAILPAAEGRRTERRIVNLAAHLREQGAQVADVEVVNLSLDGFMAAGVQSVEVGSQVWLKLPGDEPRGSRAVWVDADKAGFEFTTPLHPAILDQLTAQPHRRIPKGHFGPQANQLRR